ncbi:Protein CBG25389 [Caenorhabditis briggsae]|uniref:Protein CBG25389 n=1 Tax=Caenorhabditis briggsae TaxID=6238 RepID=B6ILH8_CAEBR|nr:Protein CBG25389 [Caenorhabditis briggsae]CAS00758.1 Protein CBG25389 [Caenorhabditis briggsae]
MKIPFMLLIFLLFVSESQAGTPCADSSQCSKMRKCIKGKCTLKPNLRKICLKPCPTGTRCVNGNCIR